MKFCHVLESAQQRWAEYRALFLFYKRMKKQLKTLAGTGEDCTTAAARDAEDVFIDTLCQQITSLNTFRMERQARSVRTLIELQADMEAGGNSEEDRDRIYQHLVNYHGETLLLMHWSILGYTAIVKLLKKHHKRTGLLVQAPHLRQLLAEPSWSTEIITSLVTQAETCINQLQVELFGNQQPGEVIGPRNPVSSSSSSEISAENQVLYDTLVSLANGEDSEEDSTGIPDDAASEGGSEEASDSRSNQQSVHTGSANLSVASHAAAGPSTSAVEGVHVTPSQSGVNPAETSSLPADPEGESFVNVPLLQQMQTALRTWEYLQTHASTPSTVLQRGEGA